MISAGQKVNKLMQDFFTAYFNERDYKAAAGFLREDIRWIGLGQSAVPEIAVRL